MASAKGGSVPSAWDGVDFGVYVKATERFFFYRYNRTWGRQFTSASPGA